MGRRLNETTAWEAYDKPTLVFFSEIPTFSGLSKRGIYNCEFESEEFYNLATETDSLNFLNGSHCLFRTSNHRLRCSLLCNNSASKEISCQKSNAS